VGQRRDDVVLIFADKTGAPTDYLLIDTVRCAPIIFNDCQSKSLLMIHYSVAPIAQRTLRNAGAQPGSMQFDELITASAMSLIGTERHANHNARLRSFPFISLMDARRNLIRP